MPLCLQLSHVTELPGVQVALHKSGQGHTIVQETRLFDDSKSETLPMRSKEGKRPVILCICCSKCCQDQKRWEMAQEVHLRLILCRSGELQVLS